MVRVIVKFMSIARQRAGTAGVEFFSANDRLGDVLKEIVDRYKMADIILNDDADVRPWARVLLNGRSQQFVGGLNAQLQDGDRIALIYPYTENF
ncbi:MAG TPA: MoaD/ThiS family protein [Candidatus Acidoferrales bacterium]|nr:MoaD/ThiS family protein [Candidatus Acidoferrales bacterium]